MYGVAPTRVCRDQPDSQSISCHPVYDNDGGVKAPNKGSLHSAD
jgi:hypothetical protein